METRGVDVGSIEFIHKRIITERDNGTASPSSRPSSARSSAVGRIAVMYDGRIIDVVSPDIAREDIGLMMAGAGKDVRDQGGRNAGLLAKPRGAGLPEEQASRKQAGPRSAQAWLPTVKVTIAAFVLALLVGAVLIVFSDRRSIEALGYFFDYPWDFFKFARQAIGDSYWAL